MRIERGSRKPDLPSMRSDNANASAGGELTTTALWKTVPLGGGSLMNWRAALAVGAKSTRRQERRVRSSLEPLELCGRRKWAVRAFRLIKTTSGRDEPGVVNSSKDTADAEVVGLNDFSVDDEAKVFDLGRPTGS